MKAHDFVVEVTKHAFYLMVATLDDTEARRSRAQHVELRRLRGQVFEGEVEALGKRDRVLRPDLLFGFDVIDLWSVAGSDAVTSCHRW